MSGSMPSSNVKATFIPGETFEKTFLFDEDSIRNFAIAAGDTNPLHHDNAVAAGSRFGGIIASGTHSTALMMGVVADQMTRTREGVGLEFSFQFRRAVPAGATMKVVWTVTRVEPNAKLGGDVIHVTGTLFREGIVHVLAAGTILCS
ncbi:MULTISPECIES: MaoC family dehydratase [unclassified Rhizobium]|uniref:MaoC family dehydratase n=1 Tax=unclassified Rhizobium TaxID=2613769 RepID=UPI0024785FE2|nr:MULTISPECIES: MaoC family dehydratase [unclassified Rhizobium]MDH7804547.1 acyl dehydratase [Rhizobium sp. AN70]